MPTGRENLMHEVHTYSVGEMNRLIKDLVEGSGAVANVQVRGEVSNFKRYPSGHCYFSLKDKTGVLKCVMFRHRALQLSSDPANGTTVVAVGRIGVYERDGVYQLYTDLLIPEGAGDLMQAYEKLKKKLAGEGLFDAERKKALPPHPRIVGIITSPAGAAVRDIITVSRRRDPGVQLLLYPVPVQGSAAAGEIAQAIRFMNRHHLAEVLIVGRGGGSMEDLWAFNEETVVRAIAASDIPVISSVGHETDFTLSDFAADQRAATPSQAAELAVTDTSQVLRQVLQMRRRMERALLRQLDERTAAYARLMSSPFLRDPRRLLEHSEERLDKAMMRLRQTLPLRIRDREYRLRQAVKVLRQPERLWETRERRWAEARRALLHPERLWEIKNRRYQAAEGALRQLFREQVTRSEERAALLAARLHAVSPLAVLARGYSVTSDESGAPVSSVEQLRWGEEIKTKFTDGEVYSVIQQIEKYGSGR